MKKKMINGKKKLDSTTEILNFITKTSKFKAIIILSIIISLYGSFVLSAGVENYFNAVLVTFQFSTFNALLFLILFINTINVCSIFNKYYFYIIRLNNKQVYLKELIKLVVRANLIVIGIIIISYLAFLNLVEFQYLFPADYNGYVNNIIYTVFYLIRYIIIAILISIISIISYVKLGEKTTIIINIMFIAFFWIVPNTNLTIASSFSILPWKYFESIRYESFSLEINYSVLFIFILEIITYLLYKNINIKYNKFNIYVILSDLEYLFRKRYKEVMLLFIIPVFVLIIVNLGISNDGLELLKMPLGLNLQEKNLNIINVVMFTFDIVIQLYLIICLYIKDLHNGLDNIFLRITTVKWYLIKELLSLIIIALLKSIQYLLILVILLVLRKNNILFKQIIIVFLSDFLYTITLQQIVTLIYMNIKSMEKIKYLIIPLIILVMLVIPKNIMWYNKYQVILVIINIILFLFSMLIYKINKSNIIQNVGGI